MKNVKSDELSLSELKKQLAETEEKFAKECLKLASQFNSKEEISEFFNDVRNEINTGRWKKEEEEEAMQKYGARQTDRNSFFGKLQDEPREEEQKQSMRCTLI